MSAGDPMGKRALFTGASPSGEPDVGAPADPVDGGGRRALFSAEERRPGTVVVECSACSSRTPVSLLALPRHLFLSVWLPGRSFSRWMRCPACAARTWCRVDWFGSVPAGAGR